eukprot:gene29642-7176_t
MGVDAVTLGKGALKKLRHEKAQRFCLDFVPKNCAEHVYEFASPAIKA